MVFLSAKGLSGIDLDRKVYRVRRRAEHEADVFFASLSSRTLTYKGMLTTYQLEQVFPDLLDPDFISEIAIVHSRFSTNTFPSWRLAQPLRLIAHNGEINTIQGNRNWMSAREGLLKSSLLGDIKDIVPICTSTGSDTVSFDEVVELLHLGGRSLPHAILMMIPEAWQNSRHMDPARRAFYEYHGSLMEPWDGPAALHFSDGTLVGAVLDRNGLRPGRFWVTADGLVIAGSEAGILDIDQATIIRKGRLQPGRMLLVDTAQGRIIEDEEIKSSLAAENPYQKWLDEYTLRLSELPEREHITYSEPINRPSPTGVRIHRGGTEGPPHPYGPFRGRTTGRHGERHPPAVLSTRPRMLFDYFTQVFAQVTNPPLDAIREVIVTSMRCASAPNSTSSNPTRVMPANSFSTSPSSTTTNSPRSSTSRTRHSSRAPSGHGWYPGYIPSERGEGTGDST